MTAAGLIHTLAGSAAAGIAKFHGRCAGFPVSGRTRQVLVLLAAGTGMFSDAVLLNTGFSLHVAGFTDCRI
jgi:hypothetical protein